MTTGTARRLLTKKEEHLGAVSTIINECPIPGAPIAMKGLQTLVRLNEKRIAKNKANCLNYLEGEASSFDPLEAMNLFANEVTTITIEQFGSFIGYLAGESVEKFAHLAVYVMFRFFFHPHFLFLFTLFSHQKPTNKHSMAFKNLRTLDPHRKTNVPVEC